MSDRPTLLYDCYYVNVWLNEQVNATIDQFLARGMFMADLVEDTLYVSLGDYEEDMVRAESLREEVLYQVRDYAKLWREEGGGSPEQRADIEGMRAVLAEWLAEVDALLAMPDLPA